MSDARLAALRDWLRGLPGLAGATLAPASADASFRRYFRVTAPDGANFIAMDAPPGREDLGPFLDVTERLLAAGLRVPRVHARDLAQGFLLLDDLGRTHYLQALDDASADRLYGAAMDALLALQGADDAGLPPFDAALLDTEMALFRDWFLGEHLGLALDEADRAALEAVAGALIDNALAQPQVFVHRDYHSRNLMVTGPDGPGIIDHQDAVTGPLTYDLVSLLRDCYIAWPAARVRGWALDFRRRLLAAGRLDPAVDEATFLRWFDLMGVQRHLKAIGIFARLCHRDGKPGYLNDIPRTLGYLRQVAPQYPETRPLAALIERLDLPRRVAR